ncbi:tyrosine-type recombinase/integrase [Enterovibrio norvegicus]|uniref:tyrosine-type recombinase/integrase n=1 Tax=Enterovibrio norvegicus TaxID=188144 RepID=UPI000C84B6D8|nr:site-specific integrase [Enterovibrio norvegicus]PML77554.1 hypothetical protein BCT69_18970 [Enterovibrio norvegicus]
MGYKNDLQRELLLNIPIAENLFANISSLETPFSTKEALSDTAQNEAYHVLPSIKALQQYNSVFNMPFLLHPSRTPWDEANSYLISLVKNKHEMQRPTEDVRRKAAVILDYRLFCDAEGIDWLDFSGRRPSARPTYRYYQYLRDVKALRPRVINQYTGYIYYFYEFIAEHWSEHRIDMTRVDTAETVRVFFKHSNRVSSKDVLARSQTQKTPPKALTPLGYVQDDGELLRPLSLEQWSEVLSIINSNNWSPLERLIVLFSAMTGARKQTVLTIRVKHIRFLEKSKPSTDGTYRLRVGAGTIVDTKNNKAQIIYLPPQLVNELVVYCHCENSMSRREKFKIKYKEKYPNLKGLIDDDIYLFLSEQGNCYFMGKDDPRYPIVKSKPTGQMVDNIKRKIIRSASESFPSEFYYHWLRATFAYLLWIALKKYITSGELDYATVIGVIQNRLSHSQRETTENYLKLFRNVNIRHESQGLFEDYIFEAIDASEFNKDN